MIFVLLACRPDPGNPDYQMGLTNGSDDTGGSDNLSGPDPYENGENRLSIGIFYEGGYSENIEINNVDTHFYIWENTMTVTPSDERIEGYYSDQVNVGTVGWCGGGVFWNAPQDLSDWTTLNISLQSISPDMASLQIGMGNNEGGALDFISPENFGFAIDGDWHTLSIDLASAFPNVDLNQVQQALTFRVDPAEAASVLRIDNLYFTDAVVTDQGDTNNGNDNEALPGPDPYQDGEPRLSLDAFYEGGYSEIVEINETDTHLYIWSNSMTISDSDDRIEGQTADEFSIGSLGWWGGGIYWDNERNLSSWSKLNFSVKSDALDISELEIGMGEGDSGLQEWVDLTTIGFVSDSEWHNFSIDIATTFPTLNTSGIQMPFNFRGVGNSGSSLLIDNLYLSVD